MDLYGKFLCFSSIFFPQVLRFGVREMWVFELDTQIFSHTLPETNINIFAPENGWLEY